MRLTLPKVGTWSPSRLPQLQNSTAKGKTPCLEVFFIPLERPRSVDVQNGLVWAIWTSAAQVMGKRRARSQTDSRPLQVRNRPDFDVCRRNATWSWKAFKEIYEITLDLIPIRGLSKKLWMPKVPGIQPKTVSGLLLGTPGKKRHLDVASAESCREYYMGKVVASPESRSWWVKWVQGRPWLVPTPKGCIMSSNQLVVGFGCTIE